MWVCGQICSSDVKVVYKRSVVALSEAVLILGDQLFYEELAIVPQ